MKEKFRQLKDSLLSKVDRQKMFIEQKRREKEFIRMFQEFAQQIFDDLNILNESPQLLNTIELGRAFSEVCDKIGQDDYYKGMFDFLTLVRQKDRELDRRIEDLKYRFEYENKEKFRVEGLRSVDYVKNILQSLNSFKEDIKREQEEKELSKSQIIEEDKRRKEEKIRQKQENLASGTQSEDENNPLLKAKSWIKDKLHPEELPENQEKIAAFRENITPEQQAQIKYDLTPKDELGLLRKFAGDYITLIQNYEAGGNYKHIKAYADAFFPFLEGYGEKFLKEKFKFLEYSEVRSEIRAKYKELEDWMARVEVKYEIKTNHNPKEPAIEPKEVENELKKAQLLRTDLIRAKEDANIFALISNQDKLVEKDQREKEKAAQRAEKERQKEIDRQEKERQKEIDRQEKERQKAEDEKRKEAERLEREKQKAEEEKRKETERLEREKQKAEEEKRKEAERLEREKQKAEEEKQKEAERLEQEKQKEAERLEREKQKADSEKQKQADLTESKQLKNEDGNSAPSNNPSESS